MTTTTRLEDTPNMSVNEPSTSPSPSSPLPSISLRPSTFCGPYHHWVITAPDSPDVLRFSSDGNSTFLPSYCKRCGAERLFRASDGGLSTFDWNSFKLNESGGLQHQVDWGELDSRENSNGSNAINPDRRTTANREIGEDYDA